MKKLRLMLSLGVALVCMSAMQAQVTGDFQGRGMQNARIKAQRVAYITSRLDLSPQEAERFWPLYNEMEEERERIFLKYDLERPADSISEADAARRIEQSFRLDEELLALRRRYYERFKQVVPASKIVKFPEADREFKREMLEELRHRREHGGGAASPAQRGGRMHEGGVASPGQRRGQ